MRAALTGLLILMTMVMPGGAKAADNLVVVELYTSQGCSSCPPADALLAELTGREDILPLAFHVDYWDYIGWKDEFADPAFTMRQKLYARAAGQRTVYTPQMIVGGRDHVVGYKPMHVADLIQKHRDAEPPMALDVEMSADGRAEVRLAPEGDLPPEMIVQLVRLTPSETVEISRGENAGRTITYTNIVSDLSQLADWDGQAPLDLDVEVPGNGPAAIVVQAAGHGPVVGAARLR